ncbi:MAG: hypothetical protein ABSB58_01650 [Gemmatimonadales bacterium]
MTGRMRVGFAVVTGLLGFAAAASAQIPGMPLFTNPRYGTGIRVHADLGQPSNGGTLGNSYTVVQGGVTFALGPLGIGANLGTSLQRAKQLAGSDSVGLNDNFTASAILQLRILGGGHNPLAMSLFGGATTEVTAQQIASASVHYKYPKLMNFPAGAALGLHVPLGLASLNLWGSGRMVFTKYVSCPAADYPGFQGISQMCNTTEHNFRWAVGADLPIFSVISLRAAFDGGKMSGQTVNVWGVGASIGIGGMR